MPFDFLSVLVVQGGALCLPMLPSGFSSLPFPITGIVVTSCILRLSIHIHMRFDRVAFEFNATHGLLVLILLGAVVESEN